MRLFSRCALLLAATLAVGLSQTPKEKFKTPNPQSPPMEASVTINGKQIWIVYHAPSVRGRKIFGGADALLPDGFVWRFGADQATFLHTDADLDIGGVAVPKGEYSLFIDLDKGKWQLIVNKQVGQWGIKDDGNANRDQKNDVGRIPLTMSKPPAPVEQQKVTLSTAGGNRAKLEIDWENVAASTQITVK